MEVEKDEKKEKEEVEEKEKEEEKELVVWQPSDRYQESL